MAEGAFIIFFVPIYETKGGVWSGMGSSKDRKGGYPQDFRTDGLGIRENNSHHIQQRGLISLTSACTSCDVAHITRRDPLIPIYPGRLDPVKRPVDECEWIGSRHFDPAEHLYAEKELREFLAVPFELLVEECRRTACRPNMDSFASIGIANDGERKIYLWTMYKLRSGRIVYNKHYFDRRLRPLRHQI